MNDATTDFGPKKVSFLTLIFRALAGLAGGTMGTAVLLIAVFLGSSLLSPLAGEEGSGMALNPLVIFIFMVVVFLSSCLANVVSTFLIGLTDRKKYATLFSAVYQVFIANIVILVFSAPVYIIVSGLSTEMMGYVAAIQILISVMASYLILEILSDVKYALLGVYGATLGLVFASAVNFILYQIFGQNPTILLFAALPVIWMVLGLFNGLTGMGYRFVYDSYGVDFLSKYVKYGQDTEPEKPEEITEKDVLSLEKDEGGKEFLEKN
ncbi:MAG: hypothetical protein ABII07_00400 [Patescibacteria group bacterium]|nr:hypothetical protein [Patescibacteria group bacterium]